MTQFIVMPRKTHGLSDLFDDAPSVLDDWQTEEPDFLIAHAPVSSCTEFERLSRPFNPLHECDPLLALENLSVRSLVVDHRLAPAPAKPTSRGFVSTQHVKLLAVLLACLSVASCTMLAKVGQVIGDPSIPVGGPDDQPSHFSLSLNATSTVNPTLVIPGNVTTTTHTPFAVNVEAASSRELTDKLQSLLEHLYENAPAQSPLEPEEPAPHLSLMEPGALGGYDDPNVSLSIPRTQQGLQQIASPISFKVLQLKDDSLLLNAHQEALAQDLQKTLGSTFIRADDYLLKPGQFKFIDQQPIDEDTRFIAVIAHFQSLDVAQWKQVLRVEPQGRQYALLVQLDEGSVDLKGEVR